MPRGEDAINRGRRKRSPYPNKTLIFQGITRHVCNPKRIDHIPLFARSHQIEENLRLSPEL
jgi:hypothetical protein